MEAIAKNVKKWQPPKIEQDNSDGKESPYPDKDDDLMSFDTFDIKQVSICLCVLLRLLYTHTHTHTHTGVDAWDYSPFVYRGGVSLS